MLFRRTIAAVSALTALAGAARANVFWSYTNSNNYSWRVTFMPDFDQKRDNASGILGLPGNGSMYCVPTATLNVAAYISRHGYPFVQPGPIYFPANTAQYNTITANLQALGVLMSTDASDGTGGNGWFNGAQAWFNPILFEVQKKYASGNWSPKTYNLFLYGQMGGLTSIAYGRYTSSGNVLLERTGGHAVTPTKVSAVGGAKELWIRNPSSDDSLFSQSPYVHQVFPISDQQFISGVSVRTMSEMITGAGDGVRRIIDGAVVVYPRFGMTNSDLNSVVLTLPLSAHNPSTAPAPQQFDFSRNFSDFDMDPLRESIIAILVGLVGATGEVVRVDPLTRTQTSLAAVNFAGRMVISRRGFIYCYERGNLVCIDPLGSAAAGPARVALPAGFEPKAIAVDDASDMVFLLGDGSVLIAIPDNLQGGFHNIPLSGPAPTGDLDLCVSPVDRSLWISSTGLDTLQQHVLDTQTGRYLPAVQISGVVDPKSVQVDDMGDVFFSSNGLLQHWEPAQRGAAGAGYQPAPNSIWAGMPAGDRLVMSRSRDNFDPATMSGPAFFNVQPEAEAGIGEQVADCQGDINFNGLINFEDLNLVVSNFNTNEAWLDGDADGDGDVDFGDLNFVLSNFNTACP